MWRRRTDDELTTTDLAYRWRQTVEGAGVARDVTNGAGVLVTVTPPVVAVDLADDAVRLTVRLLPGQLATDLTDVGRRLAEGMGCASVRVAPAQRGYVVVTLLMADPLAGVLVPSEPVPSALTPLRLGTAEDGTAVSVALGGSAHLIVQGATGSGKSVGCYSLLAQLAAAPDVRIAGSDVSGLLLAPWRDRPDAGPLALGTGDPAAHVDTLETLVADMDKRVLELGRGRDAVTLDPACPVVLVVVEEYPGLLRWVDAVDAKLGKRIRSAVARLLAEGRKAGHRVVIVTQRADAAIVGAYERSQASHRLSFRIDTADGLRMLHPEISADVAAEHATAPPGIALLSAPGQPLTRLRSPLLTYADYCSRVAAGPTG